MTRDRSRRHTLLLAVHHGLSMTAAVIRRILRAVWMVHPPPFCRDWQTHPPAVPGHAGPEPKPPDMAVDGILIGLVLATSVPAGQIEPVLPRGVALPPGVAPTDEYPVSIAVGFQDHVCPAGIPGLPGADYIEFAVGVADLVLQEPRDDFSGPCAVLGRLDLNELLPVILGRLMGLQKELRTAGTTEDRFSLRRFLARSLVASGSMRLTGEPSRASACQALAPVIRTFEQPVVSRTIFGTLAFTRFVWHWDRGVAQPIACDLTIASGLGAGRYIHPQPGRSTRPCSGAWQIRVPWTMEGFQHPGSFKPGAAAAPRP